MGVITKEWMDKYHEGLQKKLEGIEESIEEVIEDVPVATLDTVGLVKPRKVGNNNRSGLLIDAEGQLTVNINNNNGGYIDGVGQLHTNIKRSATAADIALIGQTGAPSQAAVTIDNVDKVVEAMSEPTTSVNNLNWVEIPSSNS